MLYIYMVKLTSKQADALQDEMFDTEYEILEKVKILVLCKWDSDTIKCEVEKLCEHHNKLIEELGL